MNYKSNKDLYEFYGIMIGDGCISKYICQNKTHFEIRIEGNSITDIDYYKSHLKRLISSLVNKNPAIYFRKDCNGICIRFHSKEFALFLNRELGFPLGRKGQIGINEKLLKDRDKINAVLRGIFDTDGSLYFIKNNSPKRFYPVIEIVSISKKLLQQISDVLRKKGLKVTQGHGRNSVKLNGKKNLKGWMDLIGTNHIDKKSKFLFWQEYGECPTSQELHLADRLNKLGMVDL